MVRPLVFSCRCVLALRAWCLLTAPRPAVGPVFRTGELDFPVEPNGLARLSHESWPGAILAVRGIGFTLCGAASRGRVSLALVLYVPSVGAQPFDGARVAATRPGVGGEVRTAVARPAVGGLGGVVLPGALSASLPCAAIHYEDAPLIGVRRVVGATVATLGRGLGRNAPEALLLVLPCRLHQRCSLRRGSNY